MSAIDRERREDLLDLAAELDDSPIAEGPSMAGDAIRELLGAVEQAEAARDRHAQAGGIHAREREKAEARIQAVRDMCDARENPDQWPPRPRMHGGAVFPASLMVRDVRRALDGDA